MGPIMSERRVRAERRQIDTGPPSGFRDRRRPDVRPLPEVEIFGADMTTFSIRRLQYLETVNSLEKVKH
jgi:hypothetical protein